MCAPDALKPAVRCEYADHTDFFQPVHTAHLAVLLPEVADYLRLPPGARFISDNPGYEDAWLEP
ncbi:MAG: hypothetical protein ACN6O8_24700 [Achromobacter sp.]|uniref:immunity protein Imm33 domain-containing protein n=1 Tax=Achromobacter sp. TaxID=134375 RepID=UPI003D05F2FC